VPDGPIWGTEIATEVVLGAPCRTFVDRPRHLGEVLAGATRFGRRAHLVDGSRTVAFAELQDRAAAIGRALSAAGVAPGGRVLLLGRNSINWVLTFWACIAHGWVVVPANGWWTQDQLKDAIATVHPDVVVADAGGRARLGAKQPVLALEELATSAPDGGEGPLITLVAQGEDDLAVILFTSGTSGSSKAVGLSHRSLIAAVHNIVGRHPSGELPPESVALLTVPLFHIGAVQQILLALVNGTTFAFLAGRFDPAEVLDLIERRQVSTWAAVPTMVSRVIDELERSSVHRDLTSLRSLTMGASAVPPRLQAQCRVRFPAAGQGLSTAYGLTEAGGAVAAATGLVLQERVATVGRVLRTVEVRIADADEAGVGRVWLRSPSVMVGYLGQDDDQPIDGERWLDTGDLGRLDDDGFLYLEGRAKDIVIRAGENVSCSRVERRLLEHPAIDEAAVVGLPDDDLGESVAAAIVLRAGRSCTTTELAAFAAEALPYFEVPTTWWFSDEELPKTASGKVIKREIVAGWPPRA
jgi:long-chain acyl-CoA synthetase